MQSDPYHGIGGTYIAQPDGSRQRVQGTADDPPAPSESHQEPAAEVPPEPAKKAKRKE